MSSVWLDHFRKIIITYSENRAPDPFMIWYRQRDSEGLFGNDFERVLAILIDARFDQRTTAENALENTIEVVRQGALRARIQKLLKGLRRFQVYFPPNLVTETR